jgi:dUTP pyrophosphatase
LTSTTAVVVKVKRLKHGQDLPLPAYQSGGAAGIDLMAARVGKKSLSIKPGQRRLVPTGLAIELPPGYEAQVRPRSGLAVKNGLTVLNSPGTIDSDYRGEIEVLLINHGRDKVKIRHGDRIAQLVVAPVVQAALIVVAALEATMRGAGGFGSTGMATSHAPKSRKP